MRYRGLAMHLILLISEVTSSATTFVANTNEPLIPPGSRSTSRLRNPHFKCSRTQRTDDEEWRCEGNDLTTVPSNLTSTSASLVLTLAEAGIEVLGERSLIMHTGVISELNLLDVPKFHVIEPGVFENCNKLQSIYIDKAPMLSHIDDQVFNVHLPALKTIRVIRTALLVIPWLGNLVTDGILHMVDLENNRIEGVETTRVRISAVSLYLNYNRIRSVSRMAFNGSEIGSLSLKGNTELTSIHADAFVGLVSIGTLDLSETSITTLPTNGLENLDVLKIKDTESLKVFPSIYNFNTIIEAELTYPYHCCAFKFPEKHDLIRHKLYEDLVRNISQHCGTSPTMERQRRSPDDLLSIVSKGTVGDVVSEPTIDVDINCGPVSKDYRNVVCHPKPDAFNPCEDIMGNWGLRVAVWFVAILAIVGNLAVLIVLIFSNRNMTVPNFLMCNLALADLVMGVYLVLVASTDALSIGSYFNYAIDWQSGMGCRIAGFITVFSTELSIFTLTVMTGERWYKINYAIRLDRRLTLKNAAKIAAVGWIYAACMAALPLCGISDYAKTSICLPLDNSDSVDRLYLATLLVFNGLAFVVVVACYGMIWTSVLRGREIAATASRTRSDLKIAKRMALLVFTDFACWAPIAFFGTTALAGWPLIDVTRTKILLVFFYPLNSCANPYLYALLTKQYRADIFALFARYGFCVNRAARYRSTVNGFPIHQRTRERSKRRPRDIPATNNPLHCRVTQRFQITDGHIPSVG